MTEFLSFLLNIIILVNKQSQQISFKLNIAVFNQKLRIFNLKDFFKVIKKLSIQSIAQSQTVVLQFQGVICKIKIIYYYIKKLFEQYKEKFQLQQIQDLVIYIFWQIINFLKSAHMQIDSSFLQHSGLLPLQSFIKPAQSIKNLKNHKKNHSNKTKSLLYQQLLKLVEEPIQKKRQCVIKYLKNQGELKDTEKAILNIQKEGYAIPILQVAISLSKYNKNLLQQLLDSKNIQQKQAQQAQQFQLNSKLKSDPILSLLSDSQTLKRVNKQQKQPSFVDYKNITPKKKNQLIDLKKGKFKKIKETSKGHSSVQYPKQLKDLKKQLCSLPYIKRYKNILNFKHQQQNSSKQSTKSQINHISQLNSSIRSSGSFQKAKKQRFEEDKLLQKTLNKALQKRVESLKISPRNIDLPKLSSTYQQKRNILNRKNYNSSKNLQTIQNTGNHLLKKPQLQKSQISSIRDSSNGSDLNPELIDLQKINANRNKIYNSKMYSKYWPSYSKFSPHNNTFLNSDLKKLKQKVKSFHQLSEVPSQQTLNMYYSLKKIQNNDLDKLKNQSLIQQKQLTNSKFQIKFTNLKQNYTKKLKKFIKEKKFRQFQMKQNASEQSANLIFKQIKINDKMLQKIDQIN